MEVDFPFGTRSTAWLFSNGLFAVLSFFHFKIVLSEREIGEEGMSWGNGASRERGIFHIQGMCRSVSIWRGEEGQRDGLVVLYCIDIGLDSYHQITKNAISHLCCQPASQKTQSLTIS